MATDGRLSDLVDELRAGGEVDSQGRFTLDRAQARAKMQKFQLADARRYVLELVQAAVLRGATAIAFDIDADDMHMRFDGRPFTPAELDDLWGSIFADGDGADLRGVRQLALGLNAALGLEPKRIVVRSGSQQLRLVPGRDEAFEAIDPPVAGTVIHVEQRLRLGLVVQFFRDLRGSLGEEVYLRERCVYARVAITLDGKPITGRPKLPGALGELSIEEPGAVGAIALFGREGESELRLVKDGVWIDAHPLAGCGPGFVAIVDAEALRKDVSLAKIVTDAGFEQVAGIARAARWALLSRLVEAVARGEVPPERVMPRARAEVMKFLKLRDLRKRPEVAPLARAITWMDARTCPGGHVGTVSLEALAEAVESDPETGVRTLSYAAEFYPGLVAEGPPIPRLIRAELGDLARLLSCNVVPVDEALAGAQKRAKARQEWQQRELPPRLPASRTYVLQAPIQSMWLRGEVGVTAAALAGEAIQEGKLWLIAEGCLLKQIDADLGVPGLEVAVEAKFVPSELFDDAARDATLVEVLLRALAALPGPLAQLAEKTGGGAGEAGVRGLIKAWLLLALDAEARAGLWERLGVPVTTRPNPTAVANWLPTAATLRAPTGPLAALMQVPLFEDFDGARRSLDELARRQARVGRLDQLDRSVAPDPALGREIAWLGHGDRKILAGLLGGEAALKSWAPTLAVRLRERKFWQQPERTIAAAAEVAKAEVQTAGLDPALWCHSWSREGAAVTLTLRPPIGASAPTKAPAEASIALLFAGRTLATRTMALGFGPITGTATAEALRPNADWNEVEDGEALGTLTTALQAAAWALVDGLIAARAADKLDHAAWAWLRPQVLRRMTECTRAEVMAAAPSLAKLPLFATLASRWLSLAEIEAVVAAEGAIAWVPMSTPGVALPEPPIVRADEAAIAALRKWLGESRVVDGGERVRSHRLARRLVDLPRAESLTLDPTKTWATMSLASEKSQVKGEIGIRRVDPGPTLRIELVMDGRKIGEFVHEDAPAPLQAIVCDPELPLTPGGEVDSRSKRYGQLLRRCRRATAGMIEALCERFESLPEPERAPARTLLLEYAGRRLARAKTEGSEPGRGVDAVRTLPLLIDVWGERHSLADVEERTHATIEAVTRPVEPPPETVKKERLILVVDPPARGCLEAIAEVKILDSRWEQELAAIRALAESPECTLPDLREVAWVDRKATLAGGLQAHLWIPRRPAQDDRVALARGGREIGRVAALAALPCAGIVSGEGLTFAPGTALLEPRQQSSLAKQVCRLYETLAKQVRSGGRLSASDRDAAAAWLVHVDAALAASEEPLLRELGKALTELQAALAELVPPAVRKAKAKAAKDAERRRAEAVEALQRAENRAPAQELKVEPAPQPVPAAKPAPAPQPVPAPAPKSGVTATPEQQLLALVRAELEWARARHGSVLENLRLDRLALGTGKEPGIARFDGGIVLQQRHSLIARALTRLAIGEAPDPVDLMFVMANVYTVMNEVAEEIAAHDEQAFVARLAEGLAAGLADDE